MQKGIVKWFNEVKGFGFIACEDKEYFIHYKDIQSDGFKTLKEGEHVSFEAQTSQKGLVAKSLMRSKA